MAKTKSDISQKSLVIVESPAKAKTINRYLGDNYEVIASMGHIRDLPGKNMGVDLSNDFEPTYEIIPTRKKTITTLKAAQKKAEMVYLATDLDREGEAIAWHLTQALGIPPKRSRRVVFNAITKTAIQQAFSHPHELDMDKVNAQQARRILDRIVGYEISPLLWKKVARGLSAGRVQSVAVKLIVEREREILAFIPEEFWKITGIFSVTNDPKLASAYASFLDQNGEKGPTAQQRGQWLYDHQSLEALLASVAGKEFRPNNANDAQNVHKALNNATFSVKEVKTRRTNTNPSAPFITSTLQQQAANRLGFAAKRTMRIAQQLYEGIEIKGLGSLGLITYMRTDSTHLAPDAIKTVREYINATFGANYLPETPNSYTSSNKAAQEAHEAIRPTDVTLSPDKLKKDLNDEQFKLYDLIWRRFVACQMAAGQWDVTSVAIAADTPLGEAIFKTTGRKLVFDGYMKVNGLNVGQDNQLLPHLEQEQNVFAIKTEPSQHFTTPPARYSEASLVKALEAEGIGRPSTYASIISTIQDRGYVEQIDKRFHPTDLGIVVTDKLNEHFPRVMDVAFTRHMEEQLDKVEEQHLDWVQVLHEFYDPFKETLDRAHEEMQHAKAETQPSDYTCPECDKPLVYRFGKNGRFLSCSNYPECKFASPCDRDGKMVQPEETEHKCPNCGKPMILRKGRFGSFLGCSDYPECKTTLKLDKEGNPLPPKDPPQPSGVRCYKCEGELVIRQSKRGPFLGCGRFPRCRTIVSIKQLDHLKELQSEGQWPPDSWEKADELLGRNKSAAEKKTTGKTATQNISTSKKTAARKKVTRKPPVKKT
ncbi:MAG: type I DNA topoisomerase [Sedimentisphaerales bacterium]|nr:type I DNA topoisomerase [Sedimentisphaerales bacterium]